MSSADSMEQSSTTLPRNCAKRPNDAIDDIPQAREVAPRGASDVASKRPRIMHDVAMKLFSWGTYRALLQGSHQTAFQF